MVISSLARFRDEKFIDSVGIHTQMGMCSVAVKDNTSDGERAKNQYKLYGWEYDKTFRLYFLAYLMKEMCSVSSLGFAI